MSKPSLNFSFAGKRVLITGGGRGIGRALVERLHGDGAKVFVLDNSPTLVDKLKTDFPQVKAEVCDISKWKPTQETVAAFGPVDYLVNNAAISEMHSLLDVREENWDRAAGVNLKGTLCVTQAVVKGMIENKIAGNIVNVASIAGTTGLHRSVYSTTKGGMLALTRTLACELGVHNIRVNSVSPTVVNTELFQTAIATTPGLSAEPYAERQPLKGRSVLQPEEVADSILYMLSPLSSLTNGHNLIVDGGISIS